MNHLHNSEELHDLLSKEDVNGHQESGKEGSDCSVRQSTALVIPEPCWVPDDSEIGQGSGKKPDNNGVLQLLHHHKAKTSKVLLEYK